MSAVVKLTALQALATALATAIPALAGKIIVQQAPSNVDETFPNLTIILAGKMTYEPHQRLLQADLGSNVVVYNVGSHSGPLQLRLVATSLKERATLEDAIERLATSREGGPGVIVVPVTDSDAVPWVAAFEYEDSQWMDQRALEREYESVMTFNAIVPALTTTTEYEIDTLILGLTQDMTTAFTPSTFAPPAVELVSINADGSISQA